MNRHPTLTTARFLLTDHPSYLSQRLSQPILILHQRHPDVAFARRSKSAARTDRDIRLFQQLHREIDG